MTVLTLRRRNLLEIAGREDMLSPQARVHHALSMAPARINLAPLTTGAPFLSRWPIRETPPGCSWKNDHYDSMAPPMFMLRDATVHSSSGIIALDGEVIEETLCHVTPAEQHFVPLPGGIAIQPGQISKLSGSHITILAGGKKNYFHSLLESIFRLAMLPPHVIEQATGLLCSEGAVAQDAILPLLDLPRGLQVRKVADAETLHIESLVFPWTVHGEGGYHPCVAAFFDRISAAIPDNGEKLPKRFYIDRSGARLRPLVNGAEIATRLSAIGFVPIRPEDLSFLDQARLFRGAEAIVAPHGAALTNLGFCKPGCVVLELVMDAFTNWLYRHLAALRGLTYDCVIGRCLDPWGTSHEDVSFQRWHVSADHVIAAIGYLLRA